MKNEREKAWQNTNKKSDNIKVKTFDDDISNLNVDNSFQPIEETEEKEPLTEEEKVEIRKKLFFLLIIIVIAFLFLLVVLIFDPFNKKDDTKEKANNDTTQEEEPKEVDENELKIAELDDGPINPENIELNSLVDEIIIRKYENYDNNFIGLFNNNVKVSALSDKNKLLLASKTNTFNDLIKSKIINDDLCSSNIVITTADLAKIMSDRFNTSITKYDNFVYSYYEENDYYTNIQFTLSGNNYIGKCYNIKTIPKNIIEEVFGSANKNGNDLYIDIRVVFINASGIYKDPNFKTLITNDKNATSESYMKSANTYTYHYTYLNDKYYLSDIQLSK